MLRINDTDIHSWDRIRRANFINSLSGFKSVSLVATVNDHGHTNLSLISNIVHLGADPALIGYINRPREATPHTLQNIEKNGFYTVNHVLSHMLPSAHQCSAKYPEDISEFDACGFTPEHAEGCKAPFVAESKIGYALQLEEIVPIRQNGTYLVIGKFLFARFEETVLSPDGFLKLDAAGSLCSLGLDAYYSVKCEGRFPYARP